MNTTRWTKDQLKLAFNLYCQLPFGRLHRENPEVIELARLVGRTPSSVAMKLVNFASLDPAVTSTGRTGLGNASAADREVWDEFHADWERLALESHALLTKFQAGLPTPAQGVELAEGDLDYTGETRSKVIETRVKQQFFRRAVLSSYRGRCCITGVSERRLLLASHIVPWSKDKTNRLNPRNGLCLSALHDRAFDRGLISLSDDFRVLVSGEIKRLAGEPFVSEALLAFEGYTIDMPDRFAPDASFIRSHRETQFLG